MAIKLLVSYLDRVLTLLQQMGGKRLDLKEVFKQLKQFPMV